jgi:hypothetical protein
MRRVLLWTVATILVAGGIAIFVAYREFAGTVYPERLEALRAESMAEYVPSDGMLIDEHATEGQDTWKGYFAASVSRRFELTTEAMPTEALDEGVEAAQDSGWARSDAGYSSETSVYLTKPGMQLTLSVRERAGEAPQLRVYITEGPG